VIDFVLEYPSIPTFSFDGNRLGPFVKTLDRDAKATPDQTSKPGYAKTPFEKLHRITRDFDRRIDDHMKVDRSSLTLRELVVGSPVLIFLSILNDGQLYPDANLRSSKANAWRITHCFAH
jgi:hypothetical protein